MKAAGIQPLPPVTGQDAGFRSHPAHSSREQYMTVYKAIKPEANAAAELAYALCRSERPDESKINGHTHNGKMDVPSILLTPVTVTRDNVMQTVIADRFWAVDQICTADFEAYCSAAGIK
jgi:D-xylose transport system substrate-binding protein